MKRKKNIYFLSIIAGSVVELLSKVKAMMSALGFGWKGLSAISIERWFL